MRSLFVALVAATIACSTISCTAPGRQEIEQTRADGLKSLQPITYQRTGGPADASESLSIASDGAMQAKSKLFGEGTGKLTEFQILQFGRLFEDFATFRASYPSPKPSEKPAMVEIQYGNRTVAIADDAENVPDDLSIIRNRLEDLLKNTLRQ